MKKLKTPFLFFFSDDAVLPLTLFGGQLLLNWTWTPVFFKFHQIGLVNILYIAIYMRYHIRLPVSIMGEWEYGLRGGGI